MSETKMYAKIYEVKYSRKSTEYSVWICRGEKTDILALHEEPRTVEKLLCLHPLTPYRETVELLAKMADAFLGIGGGPEVLRTKELLP